MKTIEEARHVVEHELLPQMLHDSGPMLLYNIMGNPQKVFQQLYKNSGVAEAALSEMNPAFDFKESHFTRHKDADSVLIIKVQMPTPIEANDCRAVYLCYSGQTAFNMLFTSELSDDGRFYLCGWDQDYAHLNFGISPDSGDEEAENVVLFFWEMMKNGGANAIREKAKQRKGLCAS